MVPVTLMCHVISIPNSPLSGNETSKIEWLPARVVLLTFSLLGDFEKSRSLLTDQAFDKTYSNQSLLSLSIARAWHLDLSAAETPTGVVDVVETTQKAISRATAVWIVAISLFALR